MTNARLSESTVWLASYPKSGNTWVRSILTALSTHQLLFDANHLGSGEQPYGLAGLVPRLGLDPRWLDRSELGRAREQLIRLIAVEDAGEPGDRPRFRKTHEMYRTGPPGSQPFPEECTRAAVLVARDPRDVACSYGPFFGVDLPTAVERMGVDGGAASGSPLNAAGPQPWGTWSTHARSWLAEDVPFPVHLVRYEDLQADAVTTLLPVFEAVGWQCTADELAVAVDLVRFDRLQEWESTRRFRETSPKTERFFRSGRTEGWRYELAAEQVADLEADHAEVMLRLGYELTSNARERRARADVRRSVRLQRRLPWWTLPAELGLDVTVGSVPERLDGAESPRSWVQTTQRETVVRFADGAAVWVRNGSEVTVQPASAVLDDASVEAQGDEGDSSWLLHGWAVTLATLQRGGLSLHAASVQIDGRVIAVAGRRGAGKSTTSMALRQAGHRLLVDDVTLIEVSDGTAWARPYARNVHLLPDAADALGLDFDSLPRLSRREKVAFRAEDPPKESVTIDHIVVLVPDDAEEPSLTEVRGRDRVLALAQHVARDGVARSILGEDRYFARLTELAGSVSVSVLRRPARGWSLPRVVGLIQELAVRDPRPDSRT